MTYKPVGVDGYGRFPPRVEHEILKKIEDRLELRGRSIAEFEGDDDAETLENAFSWALENDGTLLGEADRTYVVDRLVKLPHVVDGDVFVDMLGASMHFVDTGALKMDEPTAYLSTRSAAGVTRGRTKFVVDSVAGVAEGDLVKVSSPVLWAADRNLRQTYIVSDVDTTSKTVWVEGRIVGDITPAQITAAGLTGQVTVTFIRPADSFELHNVKLSAGTKTDEESLFTITGTRRVLIKNAHLYSIHRAGVAFRNCGTIEIQQSSTRKHGHVNRDIGYANVPSAPGGLGYGYGFLATDAYLFHGSECHSYAGWHGFDAAIGVSYAVLDNCTSHKDAFGFSSHEGQWVFILNGCRMLGGQGITSRSAELLVNDCLIETSLGQGISGHGSHQRLLVKDTIFDLQNVDDSVTSTALSLTSGYRNEYCYSAEEPTTEIKNVTIKGQTGAGGVHTRRGTILVDGLTIWSRLLAPAKDTALDFKVQQRAGSRLILRNTTLENIGAQNAFSIYDFERVDAKNVFGGGEIGLKSNSALLNLLGSGETTVVCEQVTSDLTDQLVRSNTGVSAVLDFYDCTASAIGGRLLLAGSTNKLRNLHNCRTRSATPGAGAYVVGQVVNHFVIAAS